MGKDETIINTRLKGDIEEIFNLIKQEFGFSNNSEALRFVIKQYWKFYKEERQFLISLDKDLAELIKNQSHLIELFKQKFDES